MEQKVRAAGAAEYRSLLAGEELTATESIKAMCYLCTGFYADGRVDCKGGVEGSATPCPLYGRMPYRNEVEKQKSKKIMLKSCARCEYPSDRDNSDYTCSLEQPQIEKDGRLFPIEGALCWKGRKVRGGGGN